MRNLKDHGLSARHEMIISLVMGQTTAWDPENYAANARFVSELGEPLLQLLDPKPGERILDLGCGDGALTAKLASFGCAVLGVDTSLAQLRASKKRDLEVALMDGRQLGLRQRFDAVFTNAALHWMKRPEKVIAEVWRCLNAGGRFVGEFGGKGNVATIRSALHAALRRRAIDPFGVDPWYYPSPDEYSHNLSQAGFNVIYIELIPRPTKLPGDISGWLEIFAQPFTHAVANADRRNYLSEVRDEVSAALRDSKGDWFADYVRLRFKAVKAGL
ncbi:MAG TPA: class I SAM-dependent methyltransferase [Candidatus Binatia bacterium]|nr:class I SAM-dependent methyltransferase [Candidatus Binatia bacterium]